MNKNSYLEMYYGASSEIVARAKRLRKNMTEAEWVLWEYLKDGKIEDFKFRRQHPMGPFIADFYCHSLKLVIEIDGSIHLEEDIKANDIERESIIIGWGITVVRFTNNDVINNIDHALSIIKEKVLMLSAYPPHP